MIISYLDYNSVWLELGKDSHLLLGPDPIGPDKIYL